MSMFMLRLLIWGCKLTPEWFNPWVIRCIGPIYSYFSNLNIKAIYAEIKYAKEIRRQVQIMWAYDGALNCGRDQPDWFEECFGNLTTFMMDETPIRFTIRAMMDHPDTPKLTLAKIKTLIFLAQTWEALKAIATWKYCLVTAIVSSFLTLLGAAQL